MLSFRQKIMNTSSGFMIHPQWQYLDRDVLRNHVLYRLILSRFDQVMQEDSNSEEIKLYTRAEMIRRYTTALKFWMNLDPLNMKHIDSSLKNLHDMGRIENSLVFKLEKSEDQFLSKVCGTVFNYIYHRLSTHYTDILEEVRANLFNSKL